LFVRPAGTALLQIPPSPKLEGISLKRQITFDTWNARVARNYQKDKQKNCASKSKQESSQPRQTVRSCPSPH
jgi:hypothetical protein